jgi:hypothetical protein
VVLAGRGERIDRNHEVLADFRQIRSTLRLGTSSTKIRSALHILCPQSSGHLLDDEPRANQVMAENAMFSAGNDARGRLVEVRTSPTLTAYNCDDIVPEKHFLTAVGSHHDNRANARRQG